MAIDLVRSPALTDAEIGRRLAIVYDLILACVSENGTTSEDKVDGPAPLVASDARSQEWDATDILLNEREKAN